MIIHLAASVYSGLINSHIQLVIPLVMFSIAVILLDDWYRSMCGAQIEQRESSIRELEALFALPDSREGQERRVWR